MIEFDKSRFTMVLLCVALSWTGFLAEARSKGAVTMESKVVAKTENARLVLAAFGYIRAIDDHYTSDLISERQSSFLALAHAANASSAHDWETYYHYAKRLASEYGSTLIEGRDYEYQYSGVFHTPGHGARIEP